MKSVRMATGGLTSGITLLRKTNCTSISFCQALEVAIDEFPVGAYFGRDTPNTADLLPIMWKEMGHKILYSSEVYNDDVPYWIILPWEVDLPDEEKAGLLMVPPNYDCKLLFLSLQCLPTTNAHPKATMESSTCYQASSAQPEALTSSI